MLATAYAGAAERLRETTPGPVARPSHVLIAMGANPISARGSLRFSLGHTSTEADVDAVIETIGPVVERARRAGLTSVLPLAGMTAE